MPDDDQDSAEAKAKAVEAAAQTAGKAVDLIHDAGRFVGRIVGPATGELGLMASDYLAHWRAKNLLRYEVQLEAYRKAAGKADQPLNPIPPRVAAPMLRAAAEEDDPNMQEMWTALLYRWTDQERRVEPEKHIVSVLATMSPLDAQVLRHVGRQGWHERPEVPGGGITADTVAAALGIERVEAQRSVDFLTGQGCVEYLPPTTIGAVGAFGRTPRFIKATAAGKLLLVLCEPPSQAEPADQPTPK